MSRVRLPTRILCTFAAIVLLTTAPGCVLWDQLLDILGFKRPAEPVQGPQGGNQGGAQPGQAPAPPPKPIEPGWYYDLNTGKLFIADSSLTPPIPAPSGPLPEAEGGEAGVRAYVFTCGAGDQEEDRFIGWLDQYTPQARQVIEQMRDPGNAGPPTPAQLDVLREGLLVRSVEEDKWVKSGSEEGARIMQSVSTRCGKGKVPRPCPPPRPRPEPPVPAPQREGPPRAPMT